MAYAHIRKLTFDPSVVGGSDHTDLAVVVRGESYHATVGNGGEQEHAQGFDRAYFLDLALTMPLDFETEPGSYNAATGEFVDHVRIPTYSHTVPTEIYEAHGDAGISTFQGNVTGTWDAAYTLVEHFKDVAGTLTPSDSTAAGNTGSLDSNPPTVTTGKLGVAGAFAGGQTSVGDGGGVTIPDDSSLTPSSAATGFTVSAWVRLTSIGTGTILSKYRSGGAEYILGFIGADLYAWIFDANNGAYYGRIATGVAATGQSDYYGFSWADPNATREDADFALYKNGVQVDDTAFDGGFPVTPRDSGATFGIGNWSDGLGPGIVGKIDEVRFSQVKRSADWFTATYNLQNNPTACYTISGELAGGSGAVLEAALASSASLTAELTTGIALSSALTSSASLTADLSTGIALAVSMSSTSAIAAALTTAIPLAADLTATATLAALLDMSGAVLTASLSSISSVSANLTTSIDLAVSLTATATVTASLTATTPIAADLSSESTLTAELTTATQLAATLASAASLTATLSTQIQLAASLSATASLVARLSVLHATITLLGAVRDLTPRVLVWDVTPDVRAADRDAAVTVSDRTPSTLVTEVR